MQDSWLLVIDNLDQIEVIDKYLPEQLPGRHTLITTRYSYCDHIPAEGLQVGELVVDDAIKLLLVRSKLGATGETPEAIAEAAEIIKELGNLALAIEQAAAYIREASRDNSSSKFLPSYRKDRKIYHSRLSKGNRMYYTSSVSTTWHLSFKQIGKNNKDATKLLRLFSFLNPDAILTDFLKAGKEGLDAERREIVSDDSRFSEALAELERFSLIGRQRDIIGGERITIHRLVQSVIQERLSPERRITIQTEILKLSAVAFQASNSNAREIRRRYLPQVTACLTNFDAKGYNLFAVSPLSDLIAGFLFNECQYIECGELNRTLLAIRTIELGPEDMRTLSVKRGLAAATCPSSGGGDVVTGMRLFRETLESQTKVLGPLHSETLWTKHGLGVAYNKAGNPEMSAKTLEETYKLRCEMLGSTDMFTLRTKFFLAEAYLDQGATDKAIKTWTDTLKIQCETLGKSHPDTVRTIFCLAKANHRNGALEEARALYKESWLQWLVIFGDEHRQTKKAMEQLEIIDALTDRRNQV